MHPPMMYNMQYVNYNQRAYINYFHQMQQINKFQYMIPQHYNQNRENCSQCNFFDFMTSTTPLIYNNKDIKIIDVLNSFLKPSLFGIDCIYKTNSDGKIVSYFPSLSVLQIDFNNNCGDNSVNNEDLNSTFEASVDSISRCSDEGIYYKEQNALWNRKGFKDVLIDIVNDYPKLINCALGEIANDSYFSILWTPTKSKFSRQSKIDNVSFLVVYRFRGNEFKNTIKFIPVLGVKTKTFNNDQEFWFRNFTCQQNDLDYAQNLFYFSGFSQRMNDFAEKNKLIKNVDYFSLSKEN